MSKDDHIEFNGQVTDALGGGFYSILTEQNTKIRAQLSGRMKRFHIRVIPGDSVKVACSVYDLTNGLITFRGK